MSSVIKKKGPYSAPFGWSRSKGENEESLRADLAVLEENL